MLSECNPSAQTINAIANLSQDIREGLLYLNSVLRNAAYNHKAKILNFKMEEHLITLYPTRITLTKLQDEQEARQLLDRIRDLVNETPRNRGNIEPSNEKREKPKAIDIFRLLPGENCGECSEPSCLAFAVKLINDEVRWRQCPLLLTKEFEANRLKLMEILPEPER